MCSSFLSVLPAFAAAIDCGKVVNEVEKMICADTELSRLDQQLAQAYRHALRRANGAEKDGIKDEQKRWIKDRDLCRDLDCLIQRYKHRFWELSQYKAEPLPGAESKRFKTEADKLVFIRKAIRGVSPSPGYCAELFRALAAGRLQAIEPDLRAESEDDPGLAPWHRCDRVDEADLAGQENPYLGFYTLGGPPFRVYRVELDCDPANGKEDLIFYSYNWSGTHEAGRLGYTWVDTYACSIRGGASLNETVLYPNPPAGYQNVNVLASYDGEPVVLELVARYPTPDKGGAVSYELNVIRIGKDDPSECSGF